MKPSVKDPNKVRLQVFLSHNGVCSRRQAFDIIMEGQVTMNGKRITEPSTPVDPAVDTIYVDGKRIEPKTFEYLMLNKPKGYVTTKAEHPSERSVYELIPPKFQHLSTAGRLDKDTEGLLLFTNDGDMINKLTHPRFNVDKTYLVEVVGELNESTKKKIEGGIYMNQYKTAPAKIERIQRIGRTTRFQIKIHEGKKRQIRIMFGRVGHKVLYLQRISQGPLFLSHAKPGKFRFLNKDEITKLKNL